MLFNYLNEREKHHKMNKENLNCKLLYQDFGPRGSVEALDSKSMNKKLNQHLENNFAISSRGAPKSR